MPYLNWVINIVAVEFSTSNMWQHVFVQIFVHSYLWRGGQICHHLTSKWCLQSILSIKNELLFARQNKTGVLGLFEFQQESQAAFLKSYFHLLNRDGAFFCKNLLYLVKTKISQHRTYLFFMNYWTRLELWLRRNLHHLKNSICWAQNKAKSHLKLPFDQSLCFWVHPILPNNWGLNSKANICKLGRGPAQTLIKFGLQACTQSLRSDLLKL